MHGKIDQNDDSLVLGACCFPIQFHHEEQVVKLYHDDDCSWKKRASIYILLHTLHCIHKVFVWNSITTYKEY